jgi:hypothetical protein
MISDTLSDAVAQIDSYLSEPATSICYQGDVRTRILILRAQMETMRMELDMPIPSFANNYATEAK